MGSVPEFVTKSVQPRMLTPTSRLSAFWAIAQQLRTKVPRLVRGEPSGALEGDAGHDVWVRVPLPASLATLVASIVKTFVLFWPRMCRQGAGDLPSDLCRARVVESKRAVLVAPSWMARPTVVKRHPFLRIAM